MSEAACRLQGTRRPHNQIVVWKRRAEVFPADLAVRPKFKMKRVAPVNQHENGLDQVVAIAASACDMQEQVELGRRADVIQGFDQKCLCLDLF